MCFSILTCSTCIHFLPLGIITATVSASLSNIIGSSRILAALVKDNIYGKLVVSANLCSIYHVVRYGLVIDIRTVFLLTLRHYI